jgi:hypothetical protein
MVGLDKLTPALVAAMRMGMGVQPSIAYMNTFGFHGNQSQSC